MANVIKGKCRHCHSRATVIRTDPGEDCTLLTHRCDNSKCRSEFQTALSYQRELKPPQTNSPSQATDWVID